MSRHNLIPCILGVIAVLALSSTHVQGDPVFTRETEPRASARAVRPAGLLAATCGKPNPDSDGDGVPDSEDGCPNDPDKTTPGACGCGTPDTDSDGDGVPDCHDMCPDNPFKIVPDECGCAIAGADSDGDGVTDCYDECPNDRFKSTPGACGCGRPDRDSDGDGVSDCNDDCPNDPNKISPGNCGCGVAETPDCSAGGGDGDDNEQSDDETPPDADNPNSPASDPQSEQSGSTPPDPENDQLDRNNISQDQAGAVPDIIGRLLCPLASIVVFGFTLAGLWYARTNRLTVRRKSRRRPWTVAADPRVGRRVRENSRSWDRPTRGSAAT